MAGAIWYCWELSILCNGYSHLQQPWFCRCRNSTILLKDISWGIKPLLESVMSSFAAWLKLSNETCFTPIGQKLIEIWTILYGLQLVCMHCCACWYMNGQVWLYWLVYPHKAPKTCEIMMQSSHVQCYISTRPLSLKLNVNSLRYW